MRALNIIAWLLLVIALTLSTLLPEDILSRSIFFRELAIQAQAFAPAIVSLAMLSRFPQVTVAMLVFAWVTSIFIFVFFLYEMLRKPIDSTTWQKYKRNRLFGTLTVYGMFPAILYAFIFLIGSNGVQEEGGRVAERITRLVVNSKVALGAASVAMSFSIGFMLAMLVVWTKILPKLFKKN